MTEHVKMKHRMQEDVKTFSDMLNSPLLSEEDKKILKLIYIEKQDYRFIGDCIGATESTIKRKHNKILKRISKILKAEL